MVEAFRRYIQTQQALGFWQGIKIGNLDISVTHSLFVDDTLLLGSYNVKEARKIKHVLDLYTTASSQKINENKSKIYLFKTNQIISNRIVNILVFSTDHLPSMYLGILFFMGDNKLNYYSPIIDRIKARVVSWKSRWLSLAGKILLINIVLATIPNYYLSVLKAPPLLIQIIHKLIRYFLWSGNIDGVNKIPLISLQDMAQVKSLGGVRIHDLENRNKAFCAKLFWKM